LTALRYLFLMRLKNRFLQMVRKPATFIFMLFLAAMLALTVVSAFIPEMEGESVYPEVPMYYLTGGLVVVYSAVFLLVAAKGLSGGASIFTLSDVNLIFTSPLLQRSVLFYGLVQQLGASLLLGFFLLFQFSWLHQMFGISFPQLLLIIVGYAAATFCGQLAAMAMYSLTVDSERARKGAEFVLYAVPSVFAVYLLVSLAAGGLADPLPRLMAGLSGPVLRCMPVGGWLAAFVGGLINGEWAAAALGLGATLLSCAAVVFVLVKKDPDYYEDVLQTAEAGYSAILAAKEGQLAESVPKNVKVGRTGLGGGWGASAFYYKHVLENRRSRVFLLSAQQLIFAAVTVAMAFFMRDAGPAAVFGFSTYMQVFTVALGRFNRELAKPYVYLVPEPPFQKLLQCLREALPGTVTEAVLIFVPVGAIMGASPLETAVLILARVAASALMIAANVLMERLFSGVISKVLSTLLYFVLVVAAFVPPVAAAVLTSMLASFDMAGALLAFSAVCVPEAALIGFLCRDTLQYAELNG